MDTVQYLKEPLNYGSNEWTPPDNKSDLVRDPNAYASAFSPQGDLWSPSQTPPSPQIQIIEVQKFPTWAVWAILGYMALVIF